MIVIGGKMTLHWMHLIPGDFYSVQITGSINEMDKKIVTLLYQPLIGAVAHSLYFSLVSELENDCFTSSKVSHRTLMTMMNLALDRIYEERKKLEGVGLLKVYKKEEAETEYSSYVYELKRPYSPKQFFKDDVLSVYLYNRVGKSRYIQLRDRFTVHTINQEEYKAITLSFNDVFTSLQQSEMVSFQGELASTLSLSQEVTVIDDTEHSYSMQSDQFDFSLLVSHLSSLVDPDVLLTETVKNTIVKLAFVYRIDPIEMSRILQDSLIQDDKIDIDALREGVKSWYKFTFESEPPALGLKTQPTNFRTMIDKKPSNEEEEMILYYETESPLALLESKSDGAKVPPSDVKIVEALILDYKLLPGVVNVLIDFILKINDMKLTKSFVDKVAAHWSRKNIKTVKDAMIFAKEEYQARIERLKAQSEVAASKEGYKNRNEKTNYVRRDRLPKWLKEDSEQKETIQEDEEKLRQEIQKMMSNLKTNKT